MIRCTWADNSEIERHYHDTEWGVPVHEDRQLFEFLILEGAQAGLSWRTILAKRENYRQSLENFAAEKLITWSTSQRDALLQNAGLVRNRLKINAVFINAAAFLKVQAQFGSFDQYLWQFVDGQPIKHAWENLADIPKTIPQAKTMSKDLAQRGFKFVGETTCYAYMQAVGMVNDHLVTCFRYHAVSHF